MVQDWVCIITIVCRTIGASRGFAPRGGPVME